MRARKLMFATEGTTQDSDNLATTSTYLVGAALSIYAGQDENRLSPGQQILAAQAICCASDGLARLIGEPLCWRVAALVGIGRLLSPTIGVGAAAQLAAAAVHDYSLALTGPAQKTPLCDVKKRIVDAVQTNDEGMLTGVVTLCLRYFRSAIHVLPPCDARNNAADELPTADGQRRSLADGKS